MSCTRCWPSARWARSPACSGPGGCRRWPSCSRCSCSTACRWPTRSSWPRGPAAPRQLARGGQQLAEQLRRGERIDAAAGRLLAAAGLDDRLGPVAAATVPHADADGGGLSRRIQPPRAMADGLCAAGPDDRPVRQRGVRVRVHHAGSVDRHHAARSPSRTNHDRGRTIDSRDSRPFRRRGRGRAEPHRAHRRGQHAAGGGPAGLGRGVRLVAAGAGPAVDRCRARPRPLARRLPANGDAPLAAAPRRPDPGRAARRGAVGPMLAEWLENRRAARSHWRAIVAALAYPLFSVADGASWSI